MANSAEDFNDAFYIFNADDNNGFVIVSGDERTEEILGYSDTGHIDIDNIPKNLIYWFDFYHNEIQHIENGQKHFTKRANRTAVAPLIKTKWNQYEPYNIMCPEKNGKHCPAGCTATAMAQVMYYYKWPKVETAEIPEYYDNCAKETLPSMPATTFDWDKMKLEYNSTNGVTNYSQEEVEAVAKLMRYCGQAVEMKYDTNESGGMVYPKDLTFNFWYGRDVRTVNRADFSTSEWEDMIYKEVSEGRPVLYTGTSINFGHEFICDGYDGNGLFHINWGWGGNSDGFFVLSILDPNFEGVYGGLSSDGFSSGQKAIIGLKPNYDAPPKKIIYFSSKSQGLPKRTSVEEDFNMGFSFDAFYAYNHTKFKGDYCLAVFRDSQLTELLLPTNGTVYDDKTTATIDFVFGANWTEECTVKLFYRIDSSDEWEDTYYWTYNYSPKDMQITEYTNKNVDYCFWRSDPLNNKAINMTINSIKFDNDLVSGEKNYATINVTNTGESYELPMYIDIDGKCVSRCSAWLSPQETGEVRFTFTPESAGEKRLDIRGIRTLLHNSDGSTEYITTYYYSEIIKVSVGTKLEVDGIYYEVDWENKELEVINKPGYRYKGDIVIPEVVNYDGNTYKVTSIGILAFNRCNEMTSVTIPNSVKSIGFVAFQNCIALTSVTIPNGVISIGSNAFEACTSLMEISIPSTVKEIKSNAFKGCVSIKTIYCHMAEPYYFYYSPFDGVDIENCTLYVPNTSLKKYQEAEVWREFKQILPLSSLDNNIIQGDANGDSEVNVSDIVEIVNFILGKPSAGFIETAADMNGDGEVNVTDIVELVSIIMSGNNVRQRSPMVESTNNDRLTLVENENQALSLCLNNESGYVASQFDIHLSTGQTLESIMLNSIRSKDHVLTYTKTNNNTYRVVVYSLGNHAYSGNHGELLSIQVSGTGSVDIDKILFVTNGQNEKWFASLHSSTTGINAVNEKEIMDIYSMDGRLVRKQVNNTNDLKKGVYIVNGKKHIVR